MLLLLACADPDTDSGKGTEPLASVAVSVPYIPDLGSDFDPRVAGCSPTQSSADGTWLVSWVYDTEGRMTEYHLTLDYGGSLDVSAEYLTWDGGCRTGYTWTSTTDDGTYSEAYEAACDDHGNTVSASLVVDEEPWYTLELANTYNGDQLDTAVGSLTWADGDVGDLAYSYTWAGSWLSAATHEWSYEEDWGQHTTSLFTSDDLGQLITESVTVCALADSEDCATEEDNAYTYDGGQRVLALDFYSAEYDLDDDGALTLSSEYGGEGTFTAGESYVPATGVYDYDDGDPIGVTFDDGC